MAAACMVGEGTMPSVREKAVPPALTLKSDNSVLFHVSLVSLELLSQWVSLHRPLKWNVCNYHHPSPRHSFSHDLHWFSQPEVLETSLPALKLRVGKPSVGLRSLIPPWVPPLLGYNSWFSTATLGHGTSSFHISVSPTRLEVVSYVCLWL